MSSAGAGRRYTRAEPLEWLRFAMSIAPHIVAAYADGDVDLRETLAIAARVTGDASPNQRRAFLGVIADQALGVRPRVLNAKRPRFPMALRHAAVDLVQMLHEDLPDLQLAPRGSAREGPASVIALARAWLRELRLFPGGAVPAERTLYEWYLEHMKARGAVLKRGRPPAR